MSRNWNGYCVMVYEAGSLRDLSCPCSRAPSGECRAALASVHTSTATAQPLAARVDTFLILHCDNTRFKYNVMYISRAAVAMAMEVLWLHWLILDSRFLGIANAVRDSTSEKKRRKT